jgi:hypothetical protein
LLSTGRPRGPGEFEEDEEEDKEDVECEMAACW